MSEEFNWDNIISYLELIKNQDSISETKVDLVSIGLKDYITMIGGEDMKEDKLWYSVRWYDEDDQEHYYGGSYSYTRAVRMLEDAAYFNAFSQRAKLFKNDSFIGELRRDK